MNQTQRLICGDCKATFEIEKGLRGSRLVEWFLWVTLVIPGFFYTLWRKSPQRKKNCDYCGSDFILPDSPEARAMINHQ